MPRPVFYPVLPPTVTEDAYARRMSRVHRRQLEEFDPVKRQVPKNGHGTNYDVGG